MPVEDGGVPTTVALSILCLSHGVILLTAWRQRDMLKLICYHAWRSFGPEFDDPRIRSRLAALKLQKFEQLFKILWHVMWARLVSLTLRGEHTIRCFSGSLRPRFVGLLLILTFFVLVGRQLFDYSKKLWHINSLYIIHHLLLACRKYSADPFELIATTPGRMTFQCLASAMLMNCRLSFSLNLAQSFLTCWLHSQNPLPGQSSTGFPNLVYLSEAYALLNMTILCGITQSWAKESLIHELSMEDAKQAAEKLLAGFCDVVVRLDASLRIKHATPQLMHFMRAMTTVHYNTLDNTLLADYLASEADKDRFAAFLNHAMCEPISAGSTDGLPKLLPVTLRHALGRDVNVALFHVHLLGKDRTSEHIIGMQEVTDGPNPPHEPLCQGASLSAHSPIIPRKVHRSSSKSSTSSGSTRGKVEVKLRKLSGLSHIQMQVTQDMEIMNYSFCFEEQGDIVPPTLSSCLIGDDRRDKLQKWLNHELNKILNDDLELATYMDSIQFRPPNAACASSDIVFHARSAAVKLSETEFTSEGDEDVWCFDLLLRDVSQMIVRRDATRQRKVLPPLSEVQLAQLDKDKLHEKMDER